MEFAGVIYTYKSKRKFFDAGNKKHIEYCINGKETKKFIIKGTWIYSTNYTSLKLMNINTYIQKSGYLARLIISSKHQSLKYDFVNKGYYKKQLIINEGVITSSMGMQESIKHLSFNEIIEKILKNDLHLSISELIPNENSFYNIESKSPKATKTEKFYEWRLVARLPSTITFICFLPIFTYFLINSMIESISILTIFIILIIVPLQFYLIMIGLKELRNIFYLRTKLINDKKLKIVPNTFK